MAALKRSYCHVIGPRSGVEALPRNCFKLAGSRIEDLSGLATDEIVSEGGGGPAETPEDA